MSDEMQREILPLKKGDNFAIGSYHFVCMGWSNGRIKAGRYEPHVGIFMHSLSVDAVMVPGFRMISRASEERP
jgi:hypothetical protein